MNVLCFGDSNTYGYDPRGFFGGRYSSDNRWVDILAKRTGWHFCNEGQNGQEITDFSHIYRQNADLYIIMLGTNDLLQGCTASQTAKRMEQALQRIPASPEKTILIVPPHLQRGEWVTDAYFVDQSKELSHHYQSLGLEFGVSVLDSGEWDVQICFDGVHFTEKGHCDFANSLYRALSERFLKGGSANA